MIHGIACATLLMAASCTVLTLECQAASAPAQNLRATHILGFENISNNKSGDLSIQGNVLRFQGSEGSGAQIIVGSIQNIFLGDQDRQVGGTTMVVGKAAVPFGGGRVIGLFAHKKYDIVTFEYLDPDGGFHGAIFQLNKGQGQVLKDEIEAGKSLTKTQETKNEIE